MIRSRIPLLLALVTLLVTAGTVLARSTEPVLPAAAEPATVAAVPNPAATIADDVCAEAQPAAAPPAEAISLQDFILCSCELCKAHPRVICRISPTGFSIVCADYYALSC